MVELPQRDHASASVVVIDLKPVVKGRPRASVELFDIVVLVRLLGLRMLR